MEKLDGVVQGALGDGLAGYRIGDQGRGARDLQALVGGEQAPVGVAVIDRRHAVGGATAADQHLEWLADRHRPRGFRSLSYRRDQSSEPPPKRPKSLSRDMNRLKIEMYRPTAIRIAFPSVSSA